MKLRQILSIGAAICVGALVYSQIQLRAAQRDHNRAITELMQTLAERPTPTRVIERHIRVDREPQHRSVETEVDTPHPTDDTSATVTTTEQDLELVDRARAQVDAVISAGYVDVHDAAKLRKTIASLTRTNHKRFTLRLARAINEDRLKLASPDALPF